MKNNIGEVLTSTNFPHALRGINLPEKSYEFVDDVAPIAGKSIIVNKCGMPFLYMADDHRRDEPQQIIAKRIGGYEMVFLGVESKRSIRLTSFSWTV